MLILKKKAPEQMYTNYIILDWSAYNSEYIASLSAMPVIANLIGDKLYEMTQNSTDRLNLSTWQLVGYSLGAHMVGQIARRIKERSGRVVIPRVTGLDPAGPVVEFAFIRDFYPRLDKDCGNINKQS